MPSHWAHAIACTWTHRVGARDTAHRVTADGHGDLIFFESGETRVVGVHDRVDHPLLTADTVAHGIRLRPEALATAFRLDAQHLRNRSLDVHDLDTSSLAGLTFDAHGIDDWISTFEIDQAVVAATASLRGGVSVHTVAAEVGLSDRQLERRFKSAVGIGPKAYQRVERFQRFLRLDGGGASLAERAHRAGYADQSHLTREARRLAGISPALLSQ